jgi:putative CocE/NonD family hydrolase
MTTTTPTTSTGRYDPLPLWSRALGRLGRSTMPAPQHRAGVERDLRIPAGDVTLAADHFAPLTADPCPTLLVRSPYGRGFPWSQFLGANLVQQGFHVLLVACRGTAGSEGEFRPFRDDVRDGPAVVAWMREQPWFDGRLATVGPSYLGYTQLALATDPPPELRAMVLLAPAATPGAAVWDHGAFRLQHGLVIAAGMDTYHRGFGALVRAGVRMARRLDRVARSQPLLDGYLAGTGGRRVPVFEDMLTRGADDDRWAGTDLRDAVTNEGPATFLVGGWWDLLLEQTLDLFTRAETAGRRPRLLVGPWTHTSMVDRAGWPVVLPALLAFLREHLGVEPSFGDAGTPSAGPSAERPVRVHVGGAGWADLATWPPAACERVWHLHPDGVLASDGPALSVSAPSVVRYDPADPPPSVGGELPARGGQVDNAGLEARADVLVLTSAPLAEPLEVAGTVTARLDLRITGEGAHVFVRLCDVDDGGTSRNVCDGILAVPRGDAAYSPGGAPVSIPMSATAHRFGAGHRLRLQVSGGAFPRYARSTGTWEPVATATHLRPLTIELRHGPGSVLAVPAVDAGARSVP